MLCMVRLALLKVFENINKPKTIPTEANKSKEKERKNKTRLHEYECWSHNIFLIWVHASVFLPCYLYAECGNTFTNLKQTY